MEASENASAPCRSPRAGQRHRLGREQLRFVRKSFQRFVGPELGFAEFAQLDQHAHLAGPGRGVVGIELQDLRITAQRRLEIPVLERRRAPRRNNTPRP